MYYLIFCRGLLVLIFLLNLPAVSWAQTSHADYLHASTPRRYVLLQNPCISVYRVTAERTGENYIGIVPAKIEIFNILVPMKRLLTFPLTMGNAKQDTLLITLSVLPHTDGAINWNPIQLDTISKNNIISIDSLIVEGAKGVQAYHSAGNPRDRTLLTRENILPIIKSGNKYLFPTTYVLSEFYHVLAKHIKNVDQADMATIDITSRVFLVENLLEDFKKRTGNQYARANYAISAGNLLQSRTNNWYEFWSNTNIVTHRSFVQQGIDEFIYQPGVGLVSGKYKGYFSLSDKFLTDSFFDTILIEKLMSAGNCCICD